MGHVMMKLAFPIILLAATVALAQTDTATGFPGANQWEASLRFGGAALRGLYSVNPPARFLAKGSQPQDISEEFDFWQKLEAAGLPDLQVRQTGSGDQHGLHLVSLVVSFKAKTPAGPRTRYVLEDQAWQQQGDAWRIVLAKHSDVVKMPQPTNTDADLYPANVDAKAEIKEAVARAGREHKRVILVFGANWCYDCRVLDFALHQPDLAKIADPNFIVVHVNIGEGKLNNDVAAEYKTPLEHGIPALAVLDSNGKLLYSQQRGEFENARAMDPDDLIAFLNKWKP
jgi:thiol-disulfide isomerase/thioredoxin